MGLKGPAQIEDEITGHGPDKGKGGRQQIMDMEEVKGTGIDRQVDKHTAPADQDEADKLVSRMAAGNQTGDYIFLGELLRTPSSWIKFSSFLFPLTKKNPSSENRSK